MLEGLRSLLLYKAEGDADLENLLCNLTDQDLAQYVDEALLKAEASHKGANVNHTVEHFIEAAKSAPVLTDMVRHAVGHHASRYRAATQAGDHDTAGRHANQAFRIMNFMKKVQAKAPADSGLSIHSVEVKPWEKSARPNPRDIGGAVHRHESLETQIRAKKPAFPKADYKYLSGGAHPMYHGDVHKVGHHPENPYPFERTKINGKFIHVDKDVKHGGAFEPHPFDFSPMVNYSEIAPNRFTPAHKAQLEKDMDEYLASPHVDRFLDMMEESHAKHGEDTEKNPFYGVAQPDGPLHDHLPHKQLEKPAAAPAAASPQTQAQPQAQAAAPQQPAAKPAAPAQPTVIRRTPGGQTTTVQAQKPAAKPAQSAEPKQGSKEEAMELISSYGELLKKPNLNPLVQQAIHRHIQELSQKHGIKAE